MKRQLALQLLQEIMPSLEDEDAAVELYRDLQLLAEYKYNKYEMYQPGRLFLENLYLWLKQFAESDRAKALNFVREKLIFVSRGEFEQLAGILYEDRIKRKQLRIAASLAGMPQYKTRKIYESSEFDEVAESSLYVGMSDGARIDFIRRHNLDINNEQVLPHYDTSSTKIAQMLGDLARRTSKAGAKFRCLFLIDDFAGSGRTLLREVVNAHVNGEHTFNGIPENWASRIRFDQVHGDLELEAEVDLRAADEDTLRAMGTGAWVDAVDVLLDKRRNGNTTLKGSLTKLSVGPIASALDEAANVSFCPLLTTEYALRRLRRLVARLPAPFTGMEILPAARLDPSVQITSTDSPIGELCENYYSADFEDEHPGSVEFGYDGCGLPLVLHHNTPNNSIYLLWARKRSEFSPLFARYERHGRERA